METKANLVHWSWLHVYAIKRLILRMHSCSGCRHWHKLRLYHHAPRPDRHRLIVGRGPVAHHWGRLRRHHHATASRCSLCMIRMRLYLDKSSPSDASASTASSLELIQVRGNI